MLKKLAYASTRVSWFNWLPAAERQQFGCRTVSSDRATSTVWPTLRVAIVGAGVGGPVLAMLLKKHLACTPVVFERAHAINEVGAGISLAPNGLRVLDSLGLALMIQDGVGEPMNVMDVTRPDGKQIVRFPAAASFQEGQHFCMTGIRRYRLLNTLLKHMDQMSIPLQLGKRLKDIQQIPAASSDNAQQTATLLFEDGSSHEADLVVGFDGLRSRTREIVKGREEPPPRYTGEEVVFAVTMDRNHDLVPPNTCRMVFGPGHQHFGSYGLGQDCSWFVSMACDKAATETWGRVKDPRNMDSIKEELADRFRGWKLVESMLTREIAVMIRVGVYDREKTAEWSRGVVTLAGDAASPIPPNLGQGGNKALEDAGVLVQCLLRHRGDLPAALRLYQTLRSQRAANLLKYSRQASQVANLQNPLAIATRNAVLRSMVGVKGTIPNDWLWQYDCEAAVQGATLGSL